MTCGTCRFRVGDECRKSPPVRLPRKFDGSATSGNRVRDEGLLWGWPKIELTDWCGEFVRPAAKPVNERKDAWAALRMVRDAIGELFGPVASIESEEAVLLRGPEYHHEAEAIIDALKRVARPAEAGETSK